MGKRYRSISHGGWEAPGGRSSCLPESDRSLGGNLLTPHTQQRSRAQERQPKGPLAQYQTWHIPRVPEAATERGLLTRGTQQASSARRGQLEL